MRQVANAKREGKLTNIEADKRIKLINANAQRNKQAATEKQSQSSQQEADKFSAEERQLGIRTQSELLEKMGLGVRLQTASDKIDSPFANNKGLDLQRLLDLAKIEQEKLVKLDELEQARAKYRKDDQGFLAKAEANYKTQVANLNLQEQAIESEYSNSVVDRTKERQGYVLNQNQLEYRVYLDNYKTVTDGMKFTGQDTRERDYEYQYNQKQTDYLQRRFDLQQQRKGIIGMSDAAIENRAQVDRMIEGLKNLEATDLSNLGAQFNRLNEVLLQTQKATRDVFGEFAFKGKFDWRKILRAPFESIANQALDKAVADLFAGLYQKGEPPASAKTYTKRATSIPEAITDSDSPRSPVANSIDPSSNPEPSQPSIPVYTKRATSIPEPNIPPPPPPPTQAEMNLHDFTAPTIDFFNNPDGSIGQRSIESYTKRSTSSIVPTLPPPSPPVPIQSEIIPVDYRAIGSKAPKIPQGLPRLGKKGQLVKLPAPPTAKGQMPTEQSYEAGGDLFGLMDGVRSKNYLSMIASGFNLLRGFQLFSTGGIAQPDSGFQQMRNGNNPIAAALRKEGSNSIVAALTPGERVLNLRETRVYESMFPKGIEGYKDGGVVGGLKPIPLNLDQSRINSSNSNNVSFNIDNRGNVEGKGGDRGMMRELEHAVTAVLIKHKQSRTGLI